MPDNDFLSQFSNQNKPESFQEEKRIKVEKPKKPINKALLVGISVGLIIVAILIYFLGFAPKIVMPNFVGQSKDNVAAWAKQQEIKTSGLLFNEEYNFDYDEDMIISQSVEEGKKITKDAKIDFVISLGANPAELITVPDLQSMDKTEIKTWIEDNKLTKTKITTSYSDDVEEDSVISFSFQGCEEDTFTRSSTLKIVISKGPAPAGTITVEDFTNKTYEQVETWANTNKIKLIKNEAFSDKVAEGLIIGQAITNGKTIKEGDEFTVTVSKGQGISVPDLSKLSKEEADKWLNDNNVKTNLKGLYADSDAYIISQSIQANTLASATEVADMAVTYRIDKAFYLNEFLGSDSVVGLYYNKVVDICNEKRSLGIDAYVGNWNASNEEYSYKYKKGQIVSCIYSSYSTGKQYYEYEKMPLDLRMNVIVSKGMIYQIDVSDIYDGTTFKLNKLIDALSDNGLAFVNKTTNDTCNIYINGKQLNYDGSVNYIEIKEDDSIVLAD